MSEREGPMWPGEGKPVAAEISERIRSILADAEAAADAMRHEAEEEAHARRRAAETEALRIIEDARREAERFLADRIHRVSELSDEILERGQSVVERLDAADQVRSELAGLVSSLGETAARLANEVRSMPGPRSPEIEVAPAAGPAPAPEAAVEPEVVAGPEPAGEREPEPIAEEPVAEQHEVEVILRAQGVPPEDAARIAPRVMEDPELALDLMARQELGLDPDELGSPAGAATSSFASFAVGALIPLLPFVLFVGGLGLVVAVAASGLALFGVGALASRLSGRPALFGGARMLLIGAAAAAVTYGIGKLFGVTMAG